MKIQNDLETSWQQEQAKQFDAACGYYELDMRPEMDRDSVAPVMAHRYAFPYRTQTRHDCERFRLPGEQCDLLARHAPEIEQRLPLRWDIP